jgi:HD-GYP domain-containing protein (c-di-GMP phosphodiesterase class II)
VLHAALETVRAGAPLTVSIGDGGSVAIAVPLRIQGALKSVVALWRSGSGFSADELEGLGLVARIIELGIENRMLLDEARSQLSGSLRAMVDLVEHRRPNYIPHTTQVADCAVMMGKAMGMRETEVADLRIAAMLQDVGMLEVPESIINAPRGLTGEEVAEVRQHPAKGAALVKTANFDVAVQHAVLFHHERLDGSGYPQGLTGDQIPLAARILAIADSYVAMISDRPHRPKMTPIAALNELRAGAGTAYDPRVVREFLRLQAAAPIATATAQTDVSTDPARVAMRGELAARPA